jgi:putative tricarboxylic transport membrane protein
MPRLQTLVGTGVLVLGLGLMVGAVLIPSEAGYSGVGPNFLPWVVSAALAACGAMLVLESLRGGFLEMEEPSGADSGHWPGFAWVSAGLLLNAALITTIGFVLSCALCFVLAVRGFHSAEGRTDRGVAESLKSAAIGVAIAAPVFWMFTKLLAINLPGLTSTGWI